MHWLYRFLMIPVACLGIGSSAAARTWYINPDGTGDTPTIQAAFDSCAAGDIVLLACGSYREHGLSMPNGIVLRGESVDACAVLDGEGAHQILSCVNLDHTTVIEGVTFANGYSDAHPYGYGGGVRCESSSCTFRDCVFTDNVATGWNSGIGGGFHCLDSSPALIRCSFTGNIAAWGMSSSHAGVGGGLFCQDSSPTIIDCSFVQNHVWGWGDAWGRGAGAVFHGGTPLLSGCVFSGNSAMQAYGGGVAIEGASPHFDNCSFEGNQGDPGGGAVYGAGGTFSGCTFSGNIAGPSTGGDRPWGGGAVDGGGSFENCVFVGNESSTTGGAVVGSSTLIYCTLIRNESPGASGIEFEDGSLALERSILAFGVGGPSVGGSGPASVSCSNVFHNEGGDYVGPIEGQAWINGNLRDWPLFCDPDSDNFYLSAGSPCLPLNNSCGAQMGAFGQGCGPISLQPLSWSEIKAKYRE